jgi:hypothetical protein
MRTDEASRVTKHPTLIPNGHWQYYKTTHGLDFFETGDAVFYFRARSQYQLAMTIRRFGIRLNPDDVQATLPKGRQLPDEPIVRPPNLIDPEDKATKGPPVSDASLQLWYELYRQVYRGSDDTEPNALSSARGMFPGKSISRERVRKLFEPRAAGRKPRNP